MNKLTLDGLIELVDSIVNSLFEFVHTHHGEDMSQTEEDDSDADEGRKRDGSDVDVLKAKDAKDNADDAQQQKSPPVLETHLLIVEAEDNHANAFDNHPKGEHERQRNGGAHNVEQEEQAEEDVEQSGQHTGATIEHESLCPKGENHLGNTGEERHNTQEPCCVHKSDVGFNDAVNAKNDEKNACDAEPDFFTCLHSLKI